MSPFLLASRVARPFAGRLQQTFSRFLPSAEPSRVLANITRDAPEIFSRKTGFSYDPRRGKFLEPTEQTGSMMGSMANLPGASTSMGVATSPSSIVNLVKSRPDVLDAISRRGQYLGGWDVGGGIQLDPARRHLTRTGAILAGMRTGQKAGFDLYKEREYNVNAFELGKSLAKPAAASAVAGVTGGTLAGLASNRMDQQKAQDIRQDFMSGLRGAPIEEPTLGTAIGSAVTGAKNDPLLGILALPYLGRLRKLGVKVGAEGGIEEAGKVFKDRARAVGVPEEKLADIADNEPEITAAAKAYGAAMSSVGKDFNKLTAEATEEAREKLLSSNNISLGLDASFFRRVKKDRSLRKDLKKVRSTETNPSQISEVFQDMNLTPVPFAANPKQLENLYLTDSMDELKDSIRAIQSNFLKFITPDDLANIDKRKGVPVFYVLHSLLSRALAASTGTSVLRLGAAQGPSSAAMGPLGESTNALAALLGNAMGTAVKTEKLKKARGYKKVIDVEKLKEKNPNITPEEIREIEKQNLAATKSNKLRQAEMNKGAIINTASQSTRIKRSRESLREIENDIVRFLKDPTSIKGIKAKIATYIFNSSAPLQSVAAVMDSWMMRAAFGNVKQGTAQSQLQYNLVHESLVDIAKKLNVSPAALQEVIWKNVRIAARQANKDAFEPLTSASYSTPFIKKGSKKQQAKMPTLEGLGKLAKEENETFAEKLIKAIEENPELSQYIEIVGEDVQFTPKFFNLLQFFD